MRFICAARPRMLKSSALPPRRRYCSSVSGTGFLDLPLPRSRSAGRAFSAAGVRSAGRAR
jgi:hypothetical protein